MISTDYWFARVVSGRNDVCTDEMLHALRSEAPEMVSVTFERACNLQCAHCIYPASPSSERDSRMVELPELVLQAVRQLKSETPRLLHEGRILRPWHVRAMKDAQLARPDLKVGLIDNGTYLKSEREFEERGLVLDWLDISVDGPEQVHNTQRRNKDAFRVAMCGIEQGRKFSSRVNSLFTTTSLNHNHLLETADLLLGRNLVDELHIATVSPARPEIGAIEQMDLHTWWQQAQVVAQRYKYNEKGDQQVFFRLFRHHELYKLASVVGRKKLLSSIEESAGLAPGEIHFELEGVPIIYAPLSLWPQETFLIDADGRYGMAYSIGHSLVDLRKGRNNQGDDLTEFTVAKLQHGFDMNTLYHRCVGQWWNFKGQQFFGEEEALFRWLNS